MSENWVNLENMHQLSWDKCQGLIPAIVQEAESKKVLMLAYMNRESLEKTLAKGLACFYSRSRASLWLKGETSGNNLEVINISTDCDLDTLLLTVKANGPSCHRDTTSCFDHVFSEWDLLWQTIDSRADASSKIEESYTQKLLSQGVHRIAQKVGEEAVETALAAKDDDLDAFLDEASDLVYHLLVLLKAKGARPQDIGRVLHSRKKAAKK